MAGSLGRNYAIAGRLSLLIIVILFFVLFLAPLARFILTAVLGGSEKWIDIFGSVITSTGTHRTLVFAILQALISALVSVIIALPGAYAFAHFRFRLKSLLYSLSLVPFVLPSIIVILCMISFYGNNGLLSRILGIDLNIIYGPLGIIIAHVFYNFALASRIVGEGWSMIDHRTVEASRNLGASPARTFVSITLPQLLPSIVTAATLIFIYCFMSFGIVLVFGGIRFATLEVRIYQEIHGKLDMVRASAYGALQLFFSLAFVLLAGKTIRSVQVAKKSSRARVVRSLRSAPAFLRAMLIAYGCGVGLFLGGPLISIIFRSIFSEGSLSFVNFRGLFDPGITPIDVEGVVRSNIGVVILRSLLLALVSGTLVFVFALFAARSSQSSTVFTGGVIRSWFTTGKPISGKARKRRSRKRSAVAGFQEALIQSPIGVSLVSLSVGLQLLYRPFVPSLVLLIIAQVFLALPFVFRMIRTTLSELPVVYGEVARGLGAGEARVLRDIEIPVLRRGLLNAYAFSVAIPYSDLTAVLSIGRGEITTIPVAIYRLIGFRSFDLAIALGVVYTLLCLLLFLWIDSTSMSEKVYRA